MSAPDPNFDFAFPSTSLPKPLHSSSQDYKHHRILSSLSPSRNSSLQKVWAEDYLDAGEYTGEFEDISHSITPPPAATLTTRPFPRSIPLSADEEACPARQTRTHQRSLTALLPFRAPHTRTNSTSPQRSPPEESKDERSFMPTLTGDKDGTIRVEEKSRGGLTSWFTGSSAPVSVGIPVGQQESLNPSPMSSRDGSPERPVAKLQKRPALSTLDSATTLNSSTPAKPATSTSRFNFFSSPKTPVQQTIQLPRSSLDNDEFLTLDITAALFPNLSPSAQDPFSPASFKNLLMNAEGLLLKFQTAYKFRTLSLHELSSTHSAVHDELEEAETRAQSLRSQLEDMASKVAEQDHTISDLVTQLAIEKQARTEEKEARERSIQLVHENRLEMEALKKASCCSHEHEDLGIERERGNWRQSGGSRFSEESDAESGPDSVFSRSRSPTLITSSAASTMTMESTPELLQASFARVVPNPNSPTSNSSHTTPRPKLVERPSTFQKILKGISTSPEPERERDVVDHMFGTGIGMGGSGCENCRGKDASVAWDTVGLLRAENKGLKDRVGSLEIAVEGALDLCAGLGL
ncbi:hypothetical protein D0Z07_1438 [Hyphodiscus hymeniophilus]|uniref:Uncharacterized protein n=1 Tax=Hyphodiscus hymeniophilus TaxID=353542 RepID=A0A9P7B0N1_9HELO|nr:hypothetical protein D0Z07_1438 [Hyphodiscus hymeniophilus]